MLLHSFSKILLKGKLRRESFKSLQKIYPLFEEMTCSCSWHWNSTKMVCINKAKNINECLQFSFIISISFLNVKNLIQASAFRREQHLLLDNYGEIIYFVNLLNSQEIFLTFIFVYLKHTYFVSGGQYYVIVIDRSRFCGNF